MPLILIVGILIFAGFVFGEIATMFKLPRVTGYIIAGVFLNLNFSNFLFDNLVYQTDIITNICLSLITFSVGGSLLYSNIKELGSGILNIALFESLFAFLIIFLGFLIITPFLGPLHDSSWIAMLIPVSILIASLGSPTDPSATLAVKHQYDAQGKVSSTIMGVAALDDVAGILIYSIAIAIAKMLVQQEEISTASLVLEPAETIFGAILLGIFFGFIFNLVMSWAGRETEGVLIVLILGLLFMCFGVSVALKFDELLSTMAMGAIVVNFNPQRDLIFKMLERYIEELIFVLFFVISGMCLDFSALTTTFTMIIGFVLFRAIGKFLGARIGASISQSPEMIKKYAAAGLIPQGGIVIGLALLITQNPAFDAFSSIILNVIIGATVIHELVGPLLAKTALKKAGEIKV